jgi:glycosyltransferase involved in cell wall biosynthesis
VNYTLDIFGAGPLEKELSSQIRASGLQDRVALRGVLDFQTGWIPQLRDRTDLFVCCHPQGDPSSTYPEVMSCGVPIAGYGNEAFLGIVKHSGAGWSVPTGDVVALAQVLQRLDRSRSELSSAAERARAFADAHVFEKTFARRTEHLVRASNRRPG